MTTHTMPHDPTSPFHAGEQAVQAKLGVRHVEAFARRAVRDYLPEQHRAFHTAQPFLVVAARDQLGRPWATLLEGPEGFATSPDPRHLHIAAKPAPGDALTHAFKDGADIGILGIELATRRRNRVNGTIAAAHTTRGPRAKIGAQNDAYTGTPGFLFEVGQSFGNCPQYIRERGWVRVPDNQPKPAIRKPALTAHQQAWVKGADTFFIASGYRGEDENPAYGMDASHRGGEPGFVDVLDETTLRFPDYSGNNHYNTIGNMVLNPRAGYLFVDFSTGSLLQITGTVSLDWNSDAIQHYPGARRLITLVIDETIEIHNAVGLRWAEDVEAVRPLRLINKVQETEDITSFTFEAKDGAALAGFLPGQHLPIEVAIPGHAGTARRTYSLSNAPTDSHYRISVKREADGLVSKYLHDHLQVGDTLRARAPAGDFVLDTGDTPLVLISAGVGITPMLSMLYAVAGDNINRPVWFVHGARSGQQYAHRDEVIALAQHHGNTTLCTTFSQPNSTDLMGIDYDHHGRINADMLKQLPHAANALYYMCGPTQFMAVMQATLENLGVPSGQIHFETFGPAGS